MKTIHLKIDRSKVLGSVPPLLFGHFIEFMHDCINQGIWAQLIQSRKFENPDENGDGISDPWYGVGMNDSHEYCLDHEMKRSSFTSQRIRIFNHFDGFSGVAQNLDLLEKDGNYDGYFWAISSGPVSCAVVVESAQGKPVFHEIFTVDCKSWKRYAFSFHNDKELERARIELRLCSEGTLWIDQASLVPQNAPCGVWPSVLGRMAALKPPVLRFPGGCFADCYHWEDGIGETDLRTAKENLHWGGMEENDFGTDEFIVLCRYLGCEPMICINFGTGTPQEAANWVEYCNGGPQTKYGALRARNGHPEPYRVRYWDIGNEAFGDWEIGHSDAKSYAERYLKFHGAMSEKDPGLCFIACGGDGNSLDQTWNKTVLQQLAGRVDVLGLHFYAPMIQNQIYDNAEIYDAVVGAAPVKYDSVLKASDETVRRICGPKTTVKLGVTEWNASYHNNSNREQTLEAALFSAGLMNTFLRNCSKLGVCNTSDLVNGWAGGIIRSENGQAFCTPSYYAIQMYVSAEPACCVFSSHDGASYVAEDVGNIGPAQSVPYVDIAACLNKSGKLVLMAVNRYPGETVRVRISGEKTGRAEVHTLWSEQVSDWNQWGEERVVPVDKNIEKGEIELLPHSVNVILFTD